ncbi:MAG: NAD(P)H-dependent oxidoreductase [Verrucomicrobiota bacterium]
MSTLLIFAHPAYEKSEANRTLRESLPAEVAGLTVCDLYERYPHFEIEVSVEKELLANHERIVWQHPLYWYSVPSLLKEWIDLVLEYGWAYGEGGDALVGKTVQSVITAGGSESAYGPDGHNRYPVTEFLRPLEQTARLCGMVYAEPLVYFKSHCLDATRCPDSIAAYHKALGI